jgi:hypothetical protein
MIELGFLGAARTVTGSKHLLRTSRATLLLDCGLFQGHRAGPLHLDVLHPGDRVRPARRWRRDGRGAPEAQLVGGSPGCAST